MGYLEIHGCGFNPSTCTSPLGRQMYFHSPELYCTHLSQTAGRCISTPLNCIVHICHRQQAGVSPQPWTVLYTSVTDSRQVYLHSPELYCTHLSQTAGRCISTALNCIVHICHRQQAGVSPQPWTVLYTSVTDSRQVYLHSPELYCTHLSQTAGRCISTALNCIVHICHRQQAGVSPQPWTVLYTSVTDSRQVYLHSPELCCTHLSQTAGRCISTALNCVVHTCHRHQAGVSPQPWTVLYTPVTDSRQVYLHSPELCCTHLSQTAGRCTYVHSPELCCTHLSQTSGRCISTALNCVVHTCHRHQAGVPPQPWTVLYTPVTDIRQVYLRPQPWTVLYTPVTDIRQVYLHTPALCCTHLSQTAGRCISTALNCVVHTCHRQQAGVLPQPWTVFYTPVTDSRQVYFHSPELCFTH